MLTASDLKLGGLYKAMLRLIVSREKTRRPWADSVSLSCINAGVVFVVMEIHDTVECSGRWTRCVGADGSGGWLVSFDKDLDISGYVQEVTSQP